MPFSISRLRHIVILVMLMHLFCASTQAGSEFPELHTQITSQKLPVKGRALFTYLGFKVYRAVLYAKPGEGDLLSDTPKALVLLYLRTIKKEQIIKAAQKNLKNNPDINYARIRERLDKLNLAYEDVHEGDRYALVYDNQTTSLFFNGILKAQVKGEDFARAYFGIWLSEHSINNNFRDKLLRSNSSNPEDGL